MQMHGQMARVPVTARQKFSEAAYFYNGMLAHRTNPVVFPYYLSAFVSALRSVTIYLQKQYAHRPAFGPVFVNGGIGYEHNSRVPRIDGLTSGRARLGRGKADSLILMIRARILLQ
jgi:hypothetical protein